MQIVFVLCDPTVPVVPVVFVLCDPTGWVKAALHDTLAVILLDV